MAETRNPSAAAVGWTAFAAYMLILIGVFHAIAGFAAILKDGFYAVSANYAFKLDSTSWGWIHLIGASSCCSPASGCSEVRSGLAPSA